MPSLASCLAPACDTGLTSGPQAPNLCPFADRPGAGVRSHR